MYLLFQHWNSHEAVFSSTFSFPWFAFLLVSILMPLNWFLEVQKWRMLRQLDWKRAWGDVLAGQGLAMVSPNRIGDGVARVSRAPNEERIAAGSSFALGSASQFLITLIAGSFALSCLPKLPLLQGFDSFLVVLAGTSSLALLLLFFFPGLLSICLPESKFGTIAQHSFSLRIWLLLLSFARYAIFSSQFAILVVALSPELLLLKVYACIGVTYLISSMVPATVLGELGVRESSAVIAFSTLGNPGSALAAVALLWVINLGIPSLAGAIYISRRTLFREARL
jgi:uncharacterized membrane protein YbhN (UPF0104 family)